MGERPERVWLVFGESMEATFGWDTEPREGWQEYIRRDVVERRLRVAVNRHCSCGGSEPHGSGRGYCGACRIWWEVCDD